MLEHLISLSTRNDITIEIDPERLRPIDADLQVPDTKKFEQHTGWKPEISFETTMLDLLNYWRDKVSSGKNFLIR
jgi:GDPmannose 4,6-dehydratase